MIDVEAVGTKSCFRIKVRAGGRCNAVNGEHSGALRVLVTVAREKGKANKSVVEVLAKALDVRKSSVEIISGLTSADKRVAVEGIDVEELGFRVNELVKE